MGRLRQRASGGDRETHRASSGPENPPRGPDRAAISLESLTHGLSPSGDSPGDATQLGDSASGAVGQVGDPVNANSRQQDSSAAPDVSSDGSLPQITVNNRQLRDVSGDALKALAAKTDPPHLFVRGGRIMRVRRDENAKPIIEPLGEKELVGHMTRSADYVDKTFTRDGPVFSSVAPPSRVASMILGICQWPFPPLDGLIEAPALRADGTILDMPGYDSLTRLYLAPAPGLSVEKVPDKPSSQDVERAKEIIEDILGDFTFRG